MGTKQEKGAEGKVELHDIIVNEKRWRVWNRIGILFFRKSDVIVVSCPKQHTAPQVVSPHREAPPRRNHDCDDKLDSNHKELSGDKYSDNLYYK